MLLRVTRWDVGIAMLVAGAVNLSMLLVAATNLQGREGTDSIEGAHAAVQDTLGAGGRIAVRDRPARVRARVVVGWRLRGRDDHAGPAARVHTAGGAPAGHPDRPRWLILAIGLDPSRALVLSQVVLSFGIPFALIPLIRLTSDRPLMGATQTTA